MSDWKSEIEQVTFQPGDFLFHENEHSYHFYIIQEGRAEIYKTGQGGRKIPLAIVAEGTSIGEFAMIDRLPRSATARAMTVIHAAKVSDVAYQKLLEELPDWAVSVMRALVERLRQTNEIIRRNGIVSSNVRQEIDSIEYDHEAGTVTNSNPFLSTSSGDDDDTPDLA